MSLDTVACVIVGGGGRMGRRICEMIGTTNGFSLAGVTEQPGSPYVGQTVKEAFGVSGAGVPVAGRLPDIAAPFDVMIDFTSPDVSIETARYAGRSGKPAVIGTTGFTVDQLREIEELTSRCACVCAPNMSMGVNVLFRLVAEAAALLGQEFDAEVLEIHHRLKKDAPSGTALRLAQVLADAYGRDLDSVGVYARKGMIGRRTAGEIGIQTLRAGDVVGEHTVLLGGPGERIELIHRAQSRDCFAHGALVAARWVCARPPGLYDMQDVLGLRQSA
jgi:4-hydroxy-tetrahydrodipicolinate reductase